MMTDKPWINTFETVNGVEVPVYRQMDDVEYASWFDLAQRDLIRKREEKLAEIQAALAESDHWCARHVEDGVSLTPARIAYRDQLRSLMRTAAQSDDPDSVLIPDPSSYQNP